MSQKLEPSNAALKKVCTEKGIPLKFERGPRAGTAKDRPALKRCKTQAPRCAAAAGAKKKGSRKACTAVQRKRILDRCGGQAMTDIAEKMVEKYLPFKKEASCLEHIAADVLSILDQSNSHVQKLLACVNNATSCSIEVDEDIMTELIRRFQHTVLKAYLRKVNA